MSLEAKHQKLIKDTLQKIRKSVDSSKFVSKRVKRSAIKVCIPKYGDTELTVVNNRLVIINSIGLQYPVSTLPLAELIGIAERL